MVLVCHKILGSDVPFAVRSARGHQLSDTHADYSGCLPVLNSLVPGTDERGTLEEGTGRTKRADAQGEIARVGAIIITESLARVIAAIRIIGVCWRSYLPPKHTN